MQAAILGTGFIAHMHAQALRTLGIKVKCAVGRKYSTAKTFATKWDIPEYGDDFNMLLSDDIDCVHVCTPPAAHFDSLMQLIKKKKNIICEKPLCLNSEQARILAGEAENSGVICAVNFNVRYHTANQHAKKIIEAGDFGPIYLIHGSYLQEFHTLPTPMGWRYDTKLSGKMRAVTEIGSHWFDLAQYLSGKQIAAVSSTFGKFNPDRFIDNTVMHRDKQSENSTPFKVDTEDAAAVTLRFEDGAIGNVLLSEVSHGRKNRLAIEITGYHKSLWWNAEQSNRINIAEKDGHAYEELLAFENGFADTFKSMFEGVYHSIEAASPASQMFPTFREAARNVLICDAVYLSASSDSKWVELREI